jgi:hypothetical protein
VALPPARCSAARQIPDVGARLASLRGCPIPVCSPGAGIPCVAVIPNPAAPFADGGEGSASWAPGVPHPCLPALADASQQGRGPVLVPLIGPIPPCPPLPRTHCYPHRPSLTPRMIQNGGTTHTGRMSHDPLRGNVSRSADHRILNSEIREHCFAATWLSFSGIEEMPRRTKRCTHKLGIC